MQEEGDQGTLYKGYYRNYCVLRIARRVDGNTPDGIGMYNRNLPERYASK
jgi:hypothetical protein